jgi:hypothetical protein
MMMMKPCQSHINQSTQKGGIQETKWKDPCLRRLTERTTQKGEPQREHQVPEPPLVARSISNKERERPLEMTFSLEEPSSIVTSHLQKRLLVHVVMPLTP